MNTWYLCISSTANVNVKGKWMACISEKGSLAFVYYCFFNNNQWQPRVDMSSFISDIATYILSATPLLMRVASNKKCLSVVGITWFPANQNIQYECSHCTSQMFQNVPKCIFAGSVYDVIYGHTHVYIDVNSRHIVTLILHFDIIYIYHIYSSCNAEIVQQFIACLSFTTWNTMKRSKHNGNTSSFVIQLSRRLSFRTVIHPNNMIPSAPLVYFVLGLSHSSFRHKPWHNILLIMSFAFHTRPRACDENDSWCSGCGMLCLFVEIFNIWNIVEWYQYAYDSIYKRSMGISYNE